MRANLFFAGLIGAALTAVSAAAADEGRYGQALERILAEAAAGRCDAERMGPGLLAACNQQIATMSAGLASLGAVRSVNFVSAQEGQYGRVETYAVAFEGGMTMNWFIGGETDGKFEIAGTQG